MKKQDREEFIAYLRTCSTTQVYRVLEKETKVYRRDYMELVNDELRRRGKEIWR